MFTPDSTSTLVFDVLGTLLDENTAFRTAAADAALAVGAEAAALSGAWSDAITAAVDAVVAGRQRYASLDVLQERTLKATLERQGFTLPPNDLWRLARFGHRIAPFADTLPAFNRLAADHSLVALTNAGLAQAISMSAAAGLRWHTLISGELIGAYKPDPRTYGFLVDRLGLDPRSCLFVAAHPWDLDAAAKHGFATAYLDRTGEGPGGEYDLAVPDLNALVDLLTP